MFFVLRRQIELAFWSKDGADTNDLQEAQLYKMTLHDGGGIHIIPTLPKNITAFWEILPIDLRLVQ